MSDPIWSSMVQYSPALTSMDKYDQIEQIWPYIAKFDQVLLNMAKYGQVWPSKVQYGPMRTSMDKYVQI